MATKKTNNREKLSPLCEIFASEVVSTLQRIAKKSNTTETIANTSSILGEPNTRRIFKIDDEELTMYNYSKATYTLPDTFNEWDYGDCHKDIYIWDSENDAQKSMKIIHALVKNKAYNFRTILYNSRSALVHYKIVVRYADCILSYIYGITKENPYYKGENLLEAILNIEVDDFIFDDKEKQRMLSDACFITDFVITEAQDLLKLIEKKRYKESVYELYETPIVDERTNTTTIGEWRDVEIR